MKFPYYYQTSINFRHYSLNVRARILSVNLATKRDIELGEDSHEIDVDPIGKDLTKGCPIKFSEDNLEEIRESFLNEILG